MIDMRVREEEKVERFGIKAWVFPIPFAELLESLKHSRVHEKACRLGLDEVARARHRSGASVEGEFWVHGFRNPFRDSMDASISVMISGRSAQAAMAGGSGTGVLMTDSTVS